MIVDILVEHPVILFFVYLAVGSVLGAIRIRGVLSVRQRSCSRPWRSPLSMNNWRYRRSWDRSGWFCLPIASGVQRSVVLRLVAHRGPCGVAGDRDPLAGCCGRRGRRTVRGLNPDLIAGAYTGALTNTRRSPQRPSSSTRGSDRWLLGHLRGRGSCDVVGRRIGAARQDKPKVRRSRNPARTTMSSVRVEMLGLPNHVN